MLNFPIVKKVTSSSDKRRKYTVQLLTTKRGTCTCAAWIYNRVPTAHGRTCKHIKTVRAEVSK